MYFVIARCFQGLEKNGEPEKSGTDFSNAVKITFTRCPFKKTNRMETRK